MGCEEAMMVNISGGSEKPKKQDVCIKSIADLQVFKDHNDLSKRIRKTLYYAKLPSTDRPSLPLSEIAVELFSQSVPRKGLEVLDMHYAASVSRRACVSPCSMMLAMVYLEQLRCRNPEYLQAISSCDLFLISMLVASKYLYEDEEDDVFNGEWAASANIDVKDLNRLEREFLAAMNWELFVKPDKFFELLHKVESVVAHHEATRRGWLTYMDLWVLAHDSTLDHCWHLLMDNVVKVIVVSTVAYAAAALTLVGVAATINHVFVPQAVMLQNVLNHSSQIVTPPLFLPSLSTTDEPNAELPSRVEKILQVDSKDFCSSTTTKSTGSSSPGSLPIQTLNSLIFCQNHLKDFTSWFNWTNKTLDSRQPSKGLPDASISMFSFKGNSFTT